MKLTVTHSNGTLSIVCQLYVSYLFFYCLMHVSSVKKNLSIVCDCSSKIQSILKSRCTGQRKLLEFCHASWASWNLAKLTRRVKNKGKKSWLRVVSCCVVDKHKAPRSGDGDRKWEDLLAKRKTKFQAERSASGQTKWSTTGVGEDSTSAAGGGGAGAHASWSRTDNWGTRGGGSNRTNRN